MLINSFIIKALNSQLSVMAISWTIWTIVEPANYVIVACLPNLRPILMRILPQSFFLLTYMRGSKPYSIVNIPWPKGRGAPKISMATAEIRGASHITGPLDRSVDRSRTAPDDLEANNELRHKESAGESVAREAAKKFTVWPEPRRM